MIQVPEPPHVARARANSLSGQYMKYKKKLERDKEFQRRVAEEGRVVLVWLGHAEVLVRWGRSAGLEFDFDWV